MNPIKTILFISLFCVWVCNCHSQNNDSVHVLPGLGIILHNDTLVIGKSNIRETCDALGISDKTNSKLVQERTTDFINGETGESGTQTDWFQKIEHKGMQLQFSSMLDKSSLKLTAINLPTPLEYTAFVDHDLILGRNCTDLNDLFTDKGKKNIREEGKVTTVFQDGISYSFKRNSNSTWKLYFISIYKKD